MGAALLATAGCFRATFADTRFASTERHDVWLHQYFFGLIRTPEVDTRFYCARGQARVAVLESAATVALTASTLGIYTPRIARVTCGREAARAGPR